MKVYLVSKEFVHCQRRSIRGMRMEIKSLSSRVKAVSKIWNKDQKKLKLKEELTPSTYGTKKTKKKKKKEELKY